MILLDTLLMGGIRFVLDKVAQAVDREMNDETFLRDQLLDAQMRLERTVRELARGFGLDPAELNLELGPLGRLH